MLTAQQPIIILKEGTRREHGRDAHENNIRAAMVIADAVRSTLGPKGMDKMLVDSLGDVVITNDGATILKEIDVEHPAAKMLIEVAETQDDECGDGTTTVVVLAGELLKQALELIEQDIHPTVIVDGYRTASRKAAEILENISFPVQDEKERKRLLKKVAETSLIGKVASTNRELLADIAYRAAHAVAEEEDGTISVDIDNVKVAKQHGGSVEDTELVDGIILKKERAHPSMPMAVKKAKILLLRVPLEIKKTEFNAQIRISDPAQLEKFLDEEETMLRSMVKRIQDSGATVVLSEKEIDDLALHYLAKAGLFVVASIGSSYMKKLVKATGGSMVSNLEDIVPDDIGKAGCVEEKKVGEDTMVFITGCKKAKAVSILVRGGTEHVVDEVERGLHDALSVIAVTMEDGTVITGGGSAAMEVSLGLQHYATTIGGRKQLAIETFAEAIEIIPRALAANAGLDSLDVLIELRKAHTAGDKHAGIDVFTGAIVNMRDQNIIEPLRVGKQAVTAAAEVATMILRIDDVIAAKSAHAGKDWEDEDEL
ncbi:MAG: thermosome subunit beta [Thermoplasmatota archaeon]